MSQSTINIPLSLPRPAACWEKMETRSVPAHADQSTHTEVRAGALSFIGIAHMHTQHTHSHTHAQAYA